MNRQAQWDTRNIFTARPHRNRKELQKLEGLLAGASQLCQRRSPEKPFTISSLSSQLLFHCPISYQLSTIADTHQSAISYIYALVQSVAASKSCDHGSKTAGQLWKQKIEEDCKWGRHPKACPAQVRGMKKGGQRV